MSEHETPPPIPQGTPEMDPYQAPVADTVPTYQSPAGMGEDASMRMLLPVGRSWMAIVAGYLGMLSVIPFLAPFAILFGALGLNDIRKSKGTAKPKHGKVRCWFAIVMGSLGTAVLIIFLFLLSKESGV